MSVNGAGRPRVLLVDDSPAVTEVMGAHLEDAGYAVSVAGDAEAALATARGAVPDVALLDCGPPPGRAFDVLRALREDPELRQTAVVVVTRAGDSARAVEALELGADDFVREPLEPVELLARVHAVLRRRRSASARGHPTLADALSLDRAGLREAVVAAASGPPAALVAVRVEQLRAVNRQLGERRGDALLTAAAGELTRAVGPGAPLGRLSGATLAAVVVRNPTSVVGSLPRGVAVDGAQADLRSAWVPVDPALPEVALVAAEDRLDG